MLQSLEPIGRFEVFRLSSLQVYEEVFKAG